MPEQFFRTPPGFYNDYHDRIESLRRQNATTNTTVRRRPVVIHETSRLFTAPTPIVTRRQPGGKRKSKRKISKRRKSKR